MPFSHTEQIADQDGDQDLRWRALEVLNSLPQDADRTRRILCLALRCLDGFIDPRGTADLAQRRPPYLQAVD